MQWIYLYWEKGSEYSTSYDIIKIPLVEAAPKDFRKFTFLKYMEDSLIEIYNDDNSGGSYTCSVPINKEYQIEQKMIFIQSNIVKSTPVANGNGKILKTIVAKNQEYMKKTIFMINPSLCHYNMTLFKQLILSLHHYLAMN